MKRLLFLTLIFCIPSLSQMLNKGALRGLDTVAVMVVIAASDEAKFTSGLENSLRTSVELKLRQNGIKVVKRAWSRFGVLVSLLGISGNDFDSFHAWAMELSVIEDVIIWRYGDTFKGPVAKVWYGGDRNWHRERSL